MIIKEVMLVKEETKFQASNENKAFSQNKKTKRGFYRQNGKTNKAISSKVRI